MTFKVVIKNEDNELISGTVGFYNENLEPLGESAIPVGGALIFSEDIPSETVFYRFTAPGYHWYGTSELSDSNTITLIRQVSGVQYIIIGGALVAAFFILKRFLNL